MEKHLTPQHQKVLAQGDTLGLRWELFFSLYDWAAQYPQTRLDLSGLTRGKDEASEGHGAAHIGGQLDTES